MLFSYTRYFPYSDFPYSISDSETTKKSGFNDPHHSMTQKDYIWEQKQRRKPKYSVCGLKERGTFMAPLRLHLITTTVVIYYVFWDVPAFFTLRSLEHHVFWISLGRRKSLVDLSVEKWSSHKIGWKESRAWFYLRIMRTVSKYLDEVSYPTLHMTLRLLILTGYSHPSGHSRSI